MVVVAVVVVVAGEVVVEGWVVVVALSPAPRAPRVVVTGTASPPLHAASNILPTTRAVFKRDSIFPITGTITTRSARVGP